MYLSERLDPHHQLESFSSSTASLDRWLTAAALTSDRMGTARTYVWTEVSDPAHTVWGYYSLCPHEVRREAVPGRLARGAPNTIPAILLARLALDQRLHGQGLGAALLHDALTRASAAIELAGGRLMVVDAINPSAADFYQRHGFTALPAQPVRLFAKASDIAASLDPPND